MDHPWLPVVAVVGATLAMLGGMAGIFWRLHVQHSSFGQDSIRALGIVIFIPTILILAFATKIEMSPLAALLGTIAGYVLSSVPADRDGK